MKTEKEQIDEMVKVIKGFDICGLFGRCFSTGANGENTRYITCPECFAEALIKAGYGDVSEYKAEIERLRTTLGQCNTELNSALESLKSQCREIGKLKAEVKQAKIDVLAELKQKYGFYICSWSHATKLLGEIIDEFIERTKNEQDTSNDTARG